MVGTIVGITVGAFDGVIDGALKNYKFKKNIKEKDFTKVQKKKKNILFWITCFHESEPKKKHMGEFIKGGGVIKQCMIRQVKN